MKKLEQEGRAAIMLIIDIELAAYGWGLTCDSSTNYSTLKGNKFLWLMKNLRYVNFSLFWIFSNEGFRRVVRHYAPKCPINTLFWNKNIKCWFLWLELFIWVWDFSWTIFWWNLAFCLSCPKWCYTYTLPVEIKALEHQTFSTQFISKFKFRLFLITLKLTFFTHPNIKIPKNKMVMPQCIEGVSMLFSKIHDPHPLQK